jgi:SAM-dependent methyltransferase
MSVEDDPNATRADARQGWEDVAQRWRALQQRVGDVTMPVSRAMIDAIEPQPGQRVLELAAGTGDLGFLAAELVRPGGTLVCSDGAEAMLEQARERAKELGIDNVAFKLIELEWIDLPTASVDAVLCRFGYMFAVDRDAAFRETRRVLRPGGRVALGTWAAVAHNPWAGARLVALREEGHPPPPPPGPFDLGSEEQLRTLLEDAGFAEIEVEPVEVSFEQAGGVDDYWQTTLGISRHIRELVKGLDPDAVHALRARIAAHLQPYVQPDGSLRMPGRALVAAATA